MPAGIRTFALVALAGGLSLSFGGGATLAVSALVVGALAAIGYWRSRDADPGMTTEMALLTTFLLGALAVRQPALASGLAVAVAILLASRTHLHRFVRRGLTEQELHDALLFAACALVVLPLTPDRTVGPFGVLNPRTLWKLAVIVMGISALGYIAQRMFGPRLGLPLAGFASGFVSSAATIGAMGRRAVEEPGLRRPAVAGAVLSTVATMVQMALVVYATSPETLRVVAVPLLFGGIAAFGYSAFFAVRLVRSRVDAESKLGHAFDLKASLLFAATVCLVLFAASALFQRWGAGGLLSAVAVAGFADAHAAAISAASLVAAGKLSAAGAALPILAALSTNSVTKMVVALAAGRGPFARQTVPGLLLVVVALWAGYFLTR